MQKDFLTNAIRFINTQTVYMDGCFHQKRTFKLVITNQELENFLYSSFAVQEPYNIALILGDIIQLEQSFQIKTIQS